MKEKIKKENFPEIQTKNEKLKISAEENRNRLYEEINTYFEEEAKVFNEEQVNADFERVNNYFATTTYANPWHNHKSISDILANCR